MPVILYFEDKFTEPTFRADVVVDITNEIGIKVSAADKNVSQVYEWLPYSNEGHVAPVEPDERIAWLWEGMTMNSSDEEVLNIPHNRIPARAAKTAARFRKELIARYGLEAGQRIRFAEVFQQCEYGTILT